MATPMCVALSEEESCYHASVHKRIWRPPEQPTLSGLKHGIWELIVSEDLRLQRLLGKVQELSCIWTELGNVAYELRDLLSTSSGPTRRPQQGYAFAFCIRS